MNWVLGWYILRNIASVGLLQHLFAFRELLPISVSEIITRFRFGGNRTASSCTVARLRSQPMWLQFMITPNNNIT